MTLRKPSRQGTLLRAPDGTYYLIRDDQLEEFRVTGTHRVHAEELIEKGNDGRGSTFSAESRLEVVGDIEAPMGYTPIFVPPHRL